MAGRAQGLDVRHLDAVDPLHGDDVAAGAFPVHPGNAETGILPDVLAKFRQRGGFQPQIHLDLGGLGQHARDLDRPQPPRGGHEALLHAGGEKIAFQIVEEAPANARPDRLDRDLGANTLALDLGRVDLGDRGRGDRLAEIEKEVVDLAAERFLDRGDRDRARKRAHAVLEFGQVHGDVRAHDIGTRCQELAELDIGRAQPVDRLGHARGPRILLGAPPRHEPRQPPCEMGGAGQLIARQRREDAFACQNPAGSQKPEIGAGRAHADTGLTASRPSGWWRCRPSCRAN